MTGVQTCALPIYAPSKSIENLDWGCDTPYTSDPQPLHKEDNGNKQESYTFRKMTKDEAKAFVAGYEQRNKGFATAHPEFDDFTLVDIDDLAGFWGAVSAGYPQFTDIKKFYDKAVAIRERRLTKMQRKLSEHLGHFESTPDTKILREVKIGRAHV